MFLLNLVCVLEVSVYVFCVFSPGYISLHAALFFLFVWFRSLRFGASNEFVFVYYHICIFLKDCFLFGSCERLSPAGFFIELPFFV